MQAVVLVGGQGTRLRPLTLTTPKPLVPLANRPLIEHIVRWLEAGGVSEVLLLTQYRAADFDRWLAEWRGIPVRAVEEPVPLGTAGAVANVAGSLHGTTAVINGDNITNLDLQAMLSAHRATGAVATIAVDAVDDPTGRGVVVLGAGGRVLRFQEKPAPGTAAANTVNTGSYLIEPAALHGVEPGRSTMWETDVFPALIAAGAPVFGWTHPHLWLDAGTPRGYLAAQAAILTGEASSPPGEARGGIWVAHHASLDPDASYRGPIAVGAETIVSAGVRLAGPLSIGRRCRVEHGGLVEHGAIWDGSVVGRGAAVVDSIIGYNCIIGEDARVERALLGDGTVVAAGAVIRDE